MLDLVTFSSLFFISKLLLADLLPRLLDSLTSSQYKSKRDVSIRKYVEMFDEFFYQLQNSGSGVDNVCHLVCLALWPYRNLELYFDKHA